MEMRPVTDLQNRFILKHLMARNTTFLLKSPVSVINILGLKAFNLHFSRLDIMLL